MSTPSSVWWRILQKICLPPKGNQSNSRFHSQPQEIYAILQQCNWSNTHINSCSSAADQHAACNRKGGVSQNCLACVSFSMRFLYFLSSWEGSVADATMYSQFRLVDLHIPQGKFYLADAGFGVCNSLLVPYCVIHYHLAEWGRANVRCVLILLYYFISHPFSDWFRPANKEELFNLRHASAQNVVE